MDEDDDLRERMMGVDVLVSEESSVSQCPGRRCWSGGWIGLVFLGVAGLVLSSCVLNLLDDNYTDGLDEHTVLNSVEAIDLILGEGDFVPNTKPPEIVALVQEDGTLVVYDGELFANYQADVWLADERQGVVWLKVYEVSTGDRLSEDSTTEATRTRVEAVSDGEPASVRRVEIGVFTIYEGDPGEFYFARFEVWFESDGGELVLLDDAVVRVQGWQH